MYKEKLVINMELLITALLYDGFESVDFMLFNLIQLALMEEYKDSDEVEFFEDMLSKEFYDGVDYNPMGLFSLKKKDELLDGSYKIERVRRYIHSLDLYDVISKKVSILGKESIYTSPFLYSDKELKILSHNKRLNKKRVS